MTITLLKLLLSILPNEYKTPIVGKLVRSGEGDVDDYRKADRMTLEGSLSKVVVY
jgi:hypothetical protein